MKQGGRTIPLYAKQWHLVIYKNQICPLAEQHYQTYMKTGKLDESRLLFKVKAEDILDKNHPQMNAPIRIEKGRLKGISGKELKKPVAK